LGWLGLLLIFTELGWYEVSPTVPPTFAPLLVGPPLLLILYLLFSTSGQQFLDKLSPVLLLSISLVRIPVELCLHLLYQDGAVPVEMTYAGRNFDILAGLTAPLVAYFVYYRKQWPRTVVKVWWVLSLALLLNIIVHAILALPSSVQLVGLDQPNIAVTTIPFVWLPGFIVPVVLFSHAALYRQLWRS
jgi:hypothetical protein